MIRNLNSEVILIVKNNTLLRKMDIDNYCKQYDNLKVICNDSFRDRYLIIDDSKVYHLGASINYIGTKTFSINKLEDREVISLLLSKVSNIFK